MHLHVCLTLALAQWPQQPNLTPLRSFAHSLNLHFFFGGGGAKIHLWYRPAMWSPSSFVSHNSTQGGQNLSLGNSLKQIKGKPSLKKGIFWVFTKRVGGLTRNPKLSSYWIWEIRGHEFQDTTVFFKLYWWNHLQYYINFFSILLLEPDR